VVGADGAVSQAVRHVDLGALVALVGDAGARTFRVRYPTVTVLVVVEAASPVLAGLANIGVT